MRWRRQNNNMMAEDLEAGRVERSLDAIQSNTALPSGEPVPPREPTVQELASIVAIVLVSDHTVSELAERLKMTPSETELAIERLLDDRTIADSGGGFYQSSQGTCAGRCGREGHTLRGQEVVIDSRSLAWWCSPCREATRSLGGPSMPEEPAVTPESLDSTLHAAASAHTRSRESAGHSS